MPEILKDFLLYKDVEFILMKEVENDLSDVLDDTDDGEISDDSNDENVSNDESDDDDNV